MKEIKIKKLLDYRDSVLGISGLVDKSTKENLRKLIKQIPKEKFAVHVGKKYSLTSNNKKLDEEIFKSKPVQNLISIFNNEKLIETIGNLFYHSNSDIMEYLEYENIISEADRPHFIDGISNQKYKLLTPIIDKNKSILWRNMYGFPKKTIKEFILANNSIPFIPSFAFSIIEKDGFIRPHTDISRKIASFMIYLPENEEKRNSSLGTTFWMPKKLSGNRVLAQEISTSEKQLTGKDYDRFTKELFFPIKTKFQDDYTLLFFRSNTSWHSFEYGKENLGPRISININFVFPEVS